MEIIASHDLDALSVELAATLSASVGDAQTRFERAFDAEVVVVPSSHMRRYLQRSLACHLGSTGANDGIVANIEFLQPRQLVYASTGNLPTWQNIRRVFGIGNNPWDADQLTWTIDDVIRSSGLTVPSHASSPLATSRRIAELFDHYTTHRPEMLRQWRDGDDTDGALLAGSLDPSHLWQRDLYRAVSDRLAPVVTLAALNLDDWDAHLAKAHDLGVLPERLSVFGVTGLSHAVRDVLRVLDHHVQVSIYSVHAAMSAWPTLTPQTNETRESWQMRLAAEHKDDASHPLHGRWCSHSVEQAALLGSPTSTLPGNPVHRSTLLGAIRADIVENRPKVLPLMTDDALEAALRGGDGTIQVHSCYGSLRQAEALRDALLRTLRDTPDLRLRDITVVCADPQKAAPILNAVCDPGVESEDGQALPRLPINVVGADSGQLDPLAEAFVALLRLASSRCSIAEVIEVLSLPPVSATFGLDDSSLESIATWAETSGVRHGINPEHRAGVTGVPLDLLAATWSDALARIAAGIAVPAPVDVVGPGGVVPYDAVTSGDIITFGALAEFLDRLGHLAALVTPDSTMTRSSWVSTALGVVDAFLTVSSNDTESMVALRSNITRLAPGTTGDTGASYPVRELITATESLMPHEFSPYSRPWESVTVTSLDGLAHRPTRVVAVFGANEDMFAGPATDGDNVLSSTPLVGEPNYSMAARQGLLHAIVCATDAVIITCDGADISNNKETPPAIALREFLEIVAATIGDTSPFGKQPVLAAHPRQNHHLDELTVGTFVPGEAFTFDRTAVEAQRVVGRPVVGAPAAAVIPVAPAPGGSATPLGAAVRAVRNPIEYHLRDVLGVELPPEQGDDSHDGRHHIDGDGVIALTVDALALSAEGRHLLARIVSDTADEDESIAEWIATRVRSGVLPPGHLGKMTAAEVAHEIRQFLAQAMFPLAGGDSIECRVALGNDTLDDRVDGVHDNGPGFLRIRFKRYHESVLLEPWIELALLTAHTNGDWDGVAQVITRSSNSNTTSPVSRILAMAGVTAAERLSSARSVLELAVKLRAAAEVDVIPLFENASHAQATSGAASTAFKRDLKYSSELRYLVGGRSFADICQDNTTDLDREIFGAPSNVARFDFYSELVWGTFARTCSVTGIGDVTDDDGDDQ